jgi:hemolysin activation/secretion protein
MTRLLFRYFAAIALAATALLGARPASAEAGPAQARVSREDLNPAARVQPSAPAAPLAAPSGQPCPFAGSALTFRLQSVAITGSTLPARKLAAAYADLIGREIPVTQICVIRDRVGRLIFDRDILARVDIPEQTISGGRLRLQVTEAMIAAVNVSADDAAAGPALARVEGYLAELRGLAPFNLSVLQRYLALAREVPGVRLAPVLRADAAGQGAIDLDVRITRDPIDVYGLVQNTGSDSLGPWSALARVDFNSFTRFGDRTSLVTSHTLSDEQWVVQLQEEARLGSGGLVGRASVAYARTRPGGVLRQLNLEGRSLAVTASAEYPLVRTAGRSLWVNGGLDVIDDRLGFRAGDILNDDKLRVAWLGLRGRIDRSLGPFNLYALGEGQLRKGLGGLGASRAGDPRLSRPAGDPRAWNLRADGELNLQRDRWFELDLYVQAQYADRPLLTYEELAAGNGTVGLGYPPSVISGDRGVMAHGELRGPVWDLPGDIGLAPFLFADRARLANLDPGTPARTLRSVGGGVRARLPQGLRCTLTYADPLDKPFATQPGKPAPRWLVSLMLVR